MKITVEKRILKGEFKSRYKIEKYETIGYKILSVENCCSGIKELIYDGVLEASNQITNYDYDEDYNSSFGLFFVRDVNYDDDYKENDYAIVNYCPVCGSKVEIIVQSEVDITDNYNELVKKQDELCKKRNNSDSIKNRNRLADEINELNKQIQELRGM